MGRASPPWGGTPLALSSDSAGLSTLFDSDPRACARGDLVVGIRVLDFGFGLRVSWFGFGGLGLELRVWGFGFWVLGLGFKIDGQGFGD